MTTSTKALAPPLALKIASGLFLAFWCLVAIFPIFWIGVMSFKLPVDAFAANPWQVIAGFVTRSERGGISLLGVLLYAGALLWLYRLPGRYATRVAAVLAPKSSPLRGRILAWLSYLVFSAVLLLWLLPVLLAFATSAFTHVPILGFVTEPLLGVTLEHYRAVWLEQAFYKNFLNSMMVTAGVVVISLSVGTLAGYALARSTSQLAFWLLVVALIFRALPHSVLVTGYLPPFINSAQILQPLWESPIIGWFFRLFGPNAPTLYGQPIAVIVVLVSINQPFTIWMLRSFFENIPNELDEAARVDGCSHFEAFRRVIMPVMWPGVITAGLFSFLLAYNDYIVCALLLDAQSQTMVPAITQFFNRETTTTDQIEAVAAAVSITAPLFVLVMVFQKQIVSGLTQGAVKG